MGLISGLLESYVQYFEASPFMCIISTISVAIVTAFVWAQIEQKMNADPSQPPMVHYWIPFIGSMITFGMQPMTFMRKYRAIYGDYFTFLMFGRKMTVCLGVDGNYFVFNARHSSVNAEDAYNHLTKPVFGEQVIYDVPNSVLMEQKKIGKAGLTIDAFKRYVPMIIEEVNMYVDEFMNKESDTIDILKAVSEMIIMTASRTLLGEEVRAQLHLGVADLYHTLDASFTPIHFLFEWLPLPSYYSCKEAHSELHGLFRSIIDNRRANNEKKYDDMLHVLMTSKYKNGEPLTDVQVANMLIAFLMAGQHTSSATTTWGLLMLANDHSLIDTTFAQMKEAMGEELPDVTYDDLKNIPMLEHIVNETLRIRSPIIQIMRKVTQPIPIPKTHYVVPAGHYLVASPSVSSTDPNYFPDPEAFSPLRWESSTVGQSASGGNDDTAGEVDYGFGSVSLKSARSPYLPFGAGRHRCIGEQFAYVQIRTILYTLLKKFDFELDPKVGLPKPDYNSMVILPTLPCLIKYKRRS
ncbi:Lanosterol 14-alpha demethylase erg11 [Zancudomyces culisetae]|uniref:Lanosterol 14-alpha demethylase erg11 n=1 Tax=Zancudomyces culisetae TaxID=1213189 RepID=A0A1R1PRW8_ZANCU|nr:Lanosterol 14-alpha demethylase erg11 [Zancudomyces culisetae]|eukprot:OMH83707.1 Lanosterol 14-alpha demethylase erg11 [Zancudomyces culisetae]